MPHLLSLQPNDLNATALGRYDELYQLENLLNRAQRPVTISAVGGLGKTTLAQLFWRTNLPKYAHVAWVFADAIFTSEGESAQKNEKRFVRAFTDNPYLKNSLQLNFEDIPGDEGQQFSRTVAALQKMPGINLLIIDNASQAAAKYVRQLSALSHWHILITSRGHILNTEQFELMPLPDDVARQIFLNIYTENLPPNQIDCLVGLLKTYNCHTLTIELLAAYSREKNLKPSELKIELTERGLLGLKKYTLENPRSDDWKSLHEHLFDAFLMEFSEPEKEIMRYCCILPPYGQQVSQAYSTESFLRELFGKLDDEENFHNILHGLARLNWLVHDKKERTFRCHPVIAEITNAQLMPDAKNCATLIENVTKLLKPDHQNNQSGIALASYIPIGESVLKGVWKEGGDFESADMRVSVLARWLARILEDWGDFYRALNYGQKMVAICEKLLPPTDKELAVTYTEIAYTYGSLGDHERQLEVYKKALLIWEEILSPDDLNLATVYSNIGSAYWSLRNNSKSLEYNFKALEIREKMLPSEHLDLATTYNNLATTYHYMRDNKNALMYYQKSLPILETLLSAQHEKLGMAYSNIGDAYREVRQFKESLKYLQQAIYTQEKSLPPEHPNFAYTYNNLAWLYHDLRDMDKACIFINRAVEIWEKSVHPHHPDLVNARASVVIFEKLRNK